MSAGYQNFVLSQQARDRRVQAQLDNPGLPDVSAGDDLGWSTFFQALKNKSDTAAANGMGFRANLGQIGQNDMPSLAAPSYYSPAGVAAANANNAALTDEQTRFRLSQAAVSEAAARAAALNDENQQRWNLSAGIERASQPGITPAQALSAAGPAAPLVQQMFDQRAAASQALDASRAKAKLEADQGDAALVKARNEAAAAPVKLSDAAIEDNARLYNQTGTMPALGMRDPGNRQLILNKAAELRQGAGSIAGDKASYKADASSLVPLQKQRDAVGAFEGTALKNMQMFVDQAGKVVDTGSPWANVPARMVSGKMIGSPDQAGFEAARQVALTEIAKVVSNPSLSGQLSDSARNEVMKFSPDSATLAQTVNVARILQQDMANRRAELDRQIGEVKGRIGGGGAPGAAPAAGDAKARAAALIAQYGGKK